MDQYQNNHPEESAPTQHAGNSLESLNTSEQHKVDVSSSFVSLKSSTNQAQEIKQQVSENNKEAKQQEKSQVHTDQYSSFVTVKSNEAENQQPIKQKQQKLQQPAVQQKPAQGDERTSSFIPVNLNNKQTSEKKSEETISTKIFQQKINDANELKKSGNVFFKEKNYVEAIKEYSEALRLLDPAYFYGATKQQCQKMAQVSSNLLCNMGFCYYNSHDMQKADLFFSEAIAINPKYTKALHKRALSRFELQRYEEAFEDIKIAFNLQKSNAEIHTAYSKILQKYNEQAKKQKQKMKELSSKIFSNESQKTNSPKKVSTKEEKPVLKVQKVQKEAEKSLWSWGSVLSFAGAAAIIGTGLYRAFKK